MRQIVSIVVTYHPDADALSAIRRLAMQTQHVIVVDNSATLDVASHLTQAFAGDPGTFTLLFNSDNLGIAAALNQGMNCAAAQSAEWVLTMDQDSQITEGMVTTLLATYDAMPEPIRLRVASLAPTLIPRGDDGTPSQGRISDTAVRTYREMPTAITSGNLVKRSAWQAIGGYDEKLFIDYVDHDFCFRLRHANHLILECEGARLRHAIGNATLIRRFGRTVSVNQHSPLRFYYIVRNGFYFWQTYRGQDAFLREDKINTLSLFLKALLFDTHRCERLLMFWRGYRDFRKGRFGRYTVCSSEK